MEIRRARREDVTDILGLIMQLAEHVDGVGLVVNNEDRLLKCIFEEKSVQCLLAVDEGKSVGYCMYFYNYSSFLGQKGIFIEDICVSKDVRGKGIGKLFFNYVAKIAEQEECSRVDWHCLLDNHNSMAFYKSLGAEHLSDETVFRLDADKIAAMAKKQQNMY